MNILICNDDGYQAPGIGALYDALADLGRVEVVAPEHNNSAKSNALTLHSPLYVHRAANGFRYVNGTPADCVHIALTGLLEWRPDLVVSGINPGVNVGRSVDSSGDQIITQIFRLNYESVSNVVPVLRPLITATGCAPRVPSHNSPLWPATVTWGKPSRLA